MAPREFDDAIVGAGPFGLDVQSNRFCDRPWEIARKPHRPDLLVPVVNAAVGDVLRQLMQQVSDVMEKSGYDQRVGRAFCACASSE
jgi:hypothetical protein